MDVVKIQQDLDRLNSQLSGLGLFPLALVSPKDCIGQKKNARYFEVDKFNQLVSNIKGDGALESAPLLYQNDELKAQGKYEIISGHHRVEAAKAGGIPYLIAFVRSDINRDQLVSKQLSHNALTGKDDQQILKELFDSIDDIDLKLASGLQNEIDKVQYESLNFRLGTYKSFLILFTPPDLDEFNRVVDLMMESTDIRTDAEVRLASMDSHPEFVDKIQRIKKVENIKSNATALHRILMLAEEGLKNLESLQATKKKEEKAEKAEQKKKAKAEAKPKTSNKLADLD